MSESPQRSFHRTITGFLVVFLLSLANSIFLNQIGYYGALLFLLMRWYREKQNPFQKNGLELFLLLFIVAEGVSAFLSPEPGNAFHNMLKRVLLMPLLFVLPAAVQDEKSIRFMYRFFLVFALATAVIYLGFSYKFVMNKLYLSELSGPSVFQYPITTSEIFSFLFLLLFALALHRGAPKKHRVLYIAGLCVAALALAATFKKTGFIGAGAGMIAVLLLGKYYKTVTAIVLGIVLLLVLNPSQSKLLILTRSGANLVPGEVSNPRVRYSDFHSLGGGKILAASDEGVHILDSNFNIASTLDFGLPVKSAARVSDTVWLAELPQSRNSLIKIRDGRAEKLSGEYCSPGNTIRITNNSSYIYFLDKDSGLTVVPLGSYGETTRFPAFREYEHIDVSDSLAVLHAPGGVAEVYALQRGVPAGKITAWHSDKDSILFIRYCGATLFIFQTGGVTVALPARDSLKILFKYPCGKITSFYAAEGGAVFTSGEGKYYMYSHAEGKIRPVHIPRVNNLPVVALYLTGTKMLVAEGKPGLARRLIDPYHPSNLTRLSLWKAGIKIFLAYPFFGVGDIDLYDFHVKFKEPYQKEIQGHLHSNYFHILATLGAFGFISFVLLLGAVALLLRKIYRSARDTEFLPYIAGTIGIFVSFLFAGLTEWNFGDHEIITLLWFAVGMAIAVSRVTAGITTPAQKQAAGL